MVITRVSFVRRLENFYLVIALAERVHLVEGEISKPSLE